MTRCINLDLERDVILFTFNKFSGESKERNLDPYPCVDKHECITFFFSFDTYCFFLVLCKK